MLSDYSSHESDKQSLEEIAHDDVSAHYVQRKKKKLKKVKMKMLLTLWQSMF